METRHITTLVIGSGASGLSLASRVNDRALVLGEKPGGLISSAHKDGFLWDYGGHVYTPSDPAVDVLLKKAGAQFHPQRKAVFSQAYIPYPVQDNAEMLGLKVERERAFVQPKNFVEYCINELGQEFTDRFMVPFNRRVWTIEPHRMDFDWVEGRVKVNKEPSASWGMNASFLYAPGDSITSVLLHEALGNGATVEEASLVSIDNLRHRATFITRSSSDVFYVKYDRVFVTTDYFTRHFHSNTIATIGIGFNEQLPLEPFHWMYCNFDSYVHRVTWLSRYYDGITPDGCDSFLLEIPLHGLAVPDDVYAIAHGSGSHVSEAVRILQNAGFYVNPDSIKTVWGAITPGYPIPTIGVRKQVAERKRELMKNGIYLAGRWGSHGYFNLQHIFRDADAAVDFAEHGSSQNEYLFSSFYYKKPETVR